MNIGPIGYQGITHEWRYPVIDRREPAGVRTIKGYISLMRRESGGRPHFTMLLLDSEGAPVITWERDDFWLFVGAARAAIEEVEGHEPEEDWTGVWKVGGISLPVGGGAAAVTTPDSSSGSRQTSQPDVS